MVRSFTIITACLNAKNGIRKTIESVLKQTYGGEIEYIIIDGASTDGTLEVIKEYEARLNAIVSEKDTGIYNAFNKGLQLAHGELIGILNSGDWYEPDALEKISDAYQDISVDIIYGRTIKNDEEGPIGDCGIFPLEKFWCWMAFPHPSTFIRKDAYKKYGMYDESYKIAADYKWLLGRYLEGAKFQFVDAVLTHFMLDGISETNSVLSAKESYEIAMNYGGKYTPPMGIEVVKDHYAGRLFRAKVSEMRRFHEGLVVDYLWSVYGRDKAEVIVWGACNGVERIISLMKSGNYTVTKLVDNNKEKVGEYFCGLPVFSPEDLLKEGETNLFVFVTGHDDAIEKQIASIDNHMLHYTTFDRMNNRLAYLYDELSLPRK